MRKTLVSTVIVIFIITMTIVWGCKRSKQTELTMGGAKSQIMSSTVTVQEDNLEAFPMKKEEILDKLDLIKDDAFYIEPTSFLNSKGLVYNETENLKLIGARVIDTVRNEVIGGFFLVPFISKEKPDEYGYLLLVGITKDTINDTVWFKIAGIPLIISKEEPKEVKDDFKRYIEEKCPWQDYWVYVPYDWYSTKSIESAIAGCALSIVIGAMAGGVPGAGLASIGCLAGIGVAVLEEYGCSGEEHCVWCIHVG